MLLQQLNETRLTVPRWRCDPLAFDLVVHEAGAFSNRQPAFEGDVIRDSDPPHRANRYRVCVKAGTQGSGRTLVQHVKNLASSLGD